jgi:hypothetical protein
MPSLYYLIWRTPRVQCTCLLERPLERSSFLGSLGQTRRRVNGDESPHHRVDYVGLLVSPMPLPDPGIPQPEPCHNHCFDAPPLPSTSKECDRYGDRTYHNISLKCFCKCAGDSDWAKAVRGCLRCMDEAGYPTDEAHSKCYHDADQKYPRPTGTLIKCALKCTQ